MANSPEALLLHTVSSSHWANQAEIQREIESTVPGLNLNVAQTPTESREMIETAEIVLSSFLPNNLLKRAASLRWVQALSSGVDFYDLDALQKRNVVLTNAAGIHAEPIAEQVFGYLLVFERGIHIGIRQQRRHVWQRYEGGEVREKTLGIIGLGEIGCKIAEYARPFGMTVIGTKRDPETAPETVDKVYPPSGLWEVLSQSDYLIVACPLTDDTRGLIGTEELGVMKSDAVLINIARGEIVDEDALIYALQQDSLGGAALDVFEEEPYTKESPLWDLSNVIITPHMAGSTPYKSERIATLFAENYKKYTDNALDNLKNRIL